MQIRELLIGALLIAACGAPPLAREEHPAPPPPSPSEPATPTEQAPPTPTMGGSGAQPDGAPCLAESECASGVCEGQGCGPDQPGACAPKARGCTRDRRQYCGCDGITFFSSGSCPGHRYASKGACSGSAP
ncbi:MAG TPA: hypothetical protein VMZ53_03415 [Kofleriaceae bacterium]|nr:hypothetical protein [Kofleriaceae bacterium]